MAYWGDEVYAIVGDVGTSTSRFGYAGEDCPKTVFSSVVGHVNAGKTSGDSMDVDTKPIAGDVNIGFRRSDLDLRFPLSEGSYSDWDAIERLWDYGFTELRAPEIKGAPFVCGAPSWSEVSDMEKMLELAFEKFELGAVYIARNAMLSAFSTGRSTTVVCDCGAGSTSAVPVVDGYVLKKASRRSPRGGDWLDEQVGQWLEEHNLGLRPRKNLANGAPSSYLKYHERTVLRDLKHSLCVVPQPPSDDGETDDVDSDAEGSTSSDKNGSNEYELPDGTKVQADQSLIHLPGLLFASPVVPEADSPTTAASAPAPAPAAAAAGGKAPSTAAADGPAPAAAAAANDEWMQHRLPGLAYRAVQASDVDVRKELLGSVVLTGGGSLFRGSSERLQHDLSEMVPSAYKVKVVTAMPIERKFSVWLGGSILASLGSFQQLWLSKAEYAEMGAARAIHQRFH